MLLLEILAVHHVFEVGSIFGCLLGLFIFLGCVTGWVETI